MATDKKGSRLFGAGWRWSGFYRYPMAASNKYLSVGGLDLAMELAE